MHLYGRMLVCVDASMSIAVSCSICIINSLATIKIQLSYFDDNLLETKNNTQYTHNEVQLVGFAEQDLVVVGRDLVWAMMVLASLHAE